MSNENILKNSFFFHKYRHHISQKVSIIITFIIGFLLLSIGFILRFYSRNLQTYKIRYDQICKNSSLSCNITFHINQDLKGNVAILYKLAGYYQNHRRIFNSKNYEQLSGKYIKSYSDLSSCSPAISKDDSSKPNDLYIPCGLMALSFFTDHYKWMNSSVANFSDESISQISDRKLFKSVNSQYKNGIRILINNTDFPGETTNEHFIVWMRAAAMPDFLKIFAKCSNCVIPKGNYQIEVQMHYPESMFHGNRYVYLVSSGKFGNCPKFLWMSYIISGGTSIFITLILTIQSLLCQNLFKRESLNAKPKNELKVENRIDELLLDDSQTVKSQSEIQLQMIS